MESTNKEEMDFRLVPHLFWEGFEARMKHNLVVRKMENVTATCKHHRVQHLHDKFDQKIPSRNTKKENHWVTQYAYSETRKHTESPVETPFSSR